MSAAVGCFGSETGPPGNPQVANDAQASADTALVLPPVFLPHTPRWEGRTRSALAPCLTSPTVNGAGPLVGDREGLDHALRTPD